MRFYFIIVLISKKEIFFMNIIRKFNVVEKERWMNYKHTIANCQGENGERLTGCQKHIDLSHEAAG